MMENILTSWKDSELIGQKNLIESKLEKYGVSYTRGFVPDQDPLVMLQRRIGILHYTTLHYTMLYAICYMLYAICYI